MAASRGIPKEERVVLLSSATCQQCSSLLLAQSKGTAVPSHGDLFSNIMTDRRAQLREEFYGNASGPRIVFPLLIRTQTPQYYLYSSSM